jgi:signal transduction histidine kinase
MVSIRIDESGRTTRCRASFNEDGTDRIEIHDSHQASRERDASEAGSDPIPEPILQAILTGSFSAPSQSFTTSRSFWTSDSARPILLREAHEGDSANRTAVIGGEFPSLALVLIPVSDQCQGVLFLASRRSDFFSKDSIHGLEAVAETLGFALAHQGTQWALRERVKELTCLYGIESVAGHPGIQLDEFLQEVALLLPPGWQYPEMTTARIVLDGRRFVTEGFADSSHRQSAAILVNDKPRGTVEVFYSGEMPEMDEGPFLKEERHLLDAVAETIGRQVAHHEAQWALRERVKELTCLYGISQVASRPAIRIDEFLRETVELLPPGWQYPEITESRITLNGQSFSTAGFAESPYRQSADIVVNGAKRGVIEVIYTERKPDAEEGPFLKEERTLINEIARQVGFVVEHREAEQETARLQEQLRHADRLATVGELSSGVAHELNEPLAAILGFGQLIKESPGLSTQASRDADKIINAALHAREVIRKLMIFTRQMPAQRSKCDLNQLVKEGLYFLESRCTKEGIVMVHQVEDGLPQILADRSQLYQVLVNLVVNAIQAMPHGGKLTISTRSDGTSVFLVVEDTGIGMSPEVQRQLFTPFFTTKDVGQGTGLGLAVVHGIVMAHGGAIEVRSEVGRGSTFEVRIPIENPSSLTEGS